tara:strand:- start:1209 stop:1364 length:156 start_codon:yes stop_codon:yes gene_type:complete
MGTLFAGVSLAIKSANMEITIAGKFLKLDANANKSRRIALSGIFRHSFGFQ